MIIKLEILKSVSFANGANPVVSVCDLEADGAEMPFATALVETVQDFANNYQKPNQEDKR